VTKKENLNDYAFKPDLIINSIKDLKLEKVLSME
jgi:hypothetical protein